MNEIQSLEKHYHNELFNKWDRIYRNCYSILKGSCSLNGLIDNFKFPFFLLAKTYLPLITLSDTISNFIFIKDFIIFVNKDGTLTYNYLVEQLKQKLYGYQILKAVVFFCDIVTLDGELSRDNIIFYYPYSCIMEHFVPFYSKDNSEISIELKKFFSDVFSSDKIMFLPQYSNAETPCFSNISSLVSSKELKAFVTFIYLEKKFKRLGEGEKCIKSLDDYKKSLYHKCLFNEINNEFHKLSSEKFNEFVSKMIWYYYHLFYRVLHYGNKLPDPELNLIRLFNDSIFLECILDKSCFSIQRMKDIINNRGMDPESRIAFVSKENPKIKMKEIKKKVNSSFKYILPCFGQKLYSKCMNFKFFNLCIKLSDNREYQKCGYFLNKRDLYIKIIDAMLIGVYMPIPDLIDKHDVRNYYPDSFIKLSDPDKIPLPKNVHFQPVKSYRRGEYPSPSTSRREPTIESSEGWFTRPKVNIETPKMRRKYDK